MNLINHIVKIAIISSSCFLAVISSLAIVQADDADPTFGGFINTGSGTAIISPTQYGDYYKANISKATTVQGGFGALINFVVSFLGFAAMIMLMYGGFNYITANGEQAKIDKGKKIIWQSIVAMLIIFGIYAAVNTALNVSSAINSNLRIPLGPVELQSGAGGTSLQLPL